jgi:hypothetical protein
MMRGVGHSVGRVGAGDQKWRCKVCKFANEKEESNCHMCKEAKAVMKEPMV